MICSRRIILFLLSAFSAVILFSSGSLLAGEDFPAYKAEVDKKLSMDMFAGCSLACAMTWDLKCSSHLPAQGENKYTVEMLNDCNFKTAWAEGAKGSGVGEWVEFHLKNYPDREPAKTTFWGMHVANGYLKSPEVWRKNSRVKQLRVDLNGKTLFYLNLEDSMNNQSFNFPPVTVGPGDVIRLTIKRVYPGDSCSDACITEMVPMGAH